MKTQQINSLNRFVCIGILFLLVACSSGTNNLIQNNNASISTLDSLIGKKQFDILKIYGVPIDSTFLILSDSSRLHEYQLNLINVVKVRNDVIIKELFWKINDQNVVVWFKYDENNWRVIDVLMYGNSIQF